MAGLVGIGVWN